MTNLANTFLKKKNIKIVKAKDIFLYSQNKKFVDLTGGYTGHAILGWGNKAIINAIKKQSRKYCHIDYKMYQDPNREKLAKLILSKTKSKLDRVFLVGSSGAEACDAAVKLSYQYFFEKGLKKKRYFISRKQSYHGCNISSLSLGDRPNLYFYDKILSKNCKKISEHNIYRHKKKNESEENYSTRSADELEKKILSLGPENVCAFVAETIQGGLIGDVPPSKNYWKKIRKICDKYEIHLILDEVWCGTGTTGKPFCFDWDGITPDIVFLSKTLAAGYGALSAIATTKKIINLIKKKSGQIYYSNTHQGHSLSVAAAVEVQKIIQNQNFLDSINKKGDYLREILHQELKNNEFFYNVRGRGLRNSLEYKCSDNAKFGSILKKKMFDKKILIDAKWHRVAFPLALNITKKQLEQNLELFISVFKEISKDWLRLKNKKYDNYFF